MTAEQFNQVIQALNQGNWRLLCLVLVVVVAWVVVLAFQLSIMKRIEAAIENKQHFSRVRYEREMKIYEELWPKLCELEAISLSLRSGFGFTTSAESTEEEETLKRKQKFWDAHKAFFLAVSYSRPFYSTDVWKEVNKLIKLCWGEAVEWGLLAHPALMRARENREDYYKNAEKNADAIKIQIEKICEAIRTRLSKFDGA